VLERALARDFVNDHGVHIGLFSCVNC
jgi:hypothetical protein